MSFDTSIFCLAVHSTRSSVIYLVLYNFFYRMSSFQIIETSAESIELPSMVKEEVNVPLNPEVRITVTNIDSDSSECEQVDTSILSRLKKRTPRPRSSADVTNLVEQGKLTRHGIENPVYQASLTSLTETEILKRNKLKLKPQASQYVPDKAKTHSSTVSGPASCSSDPSLRGSDVIVSIDLEDCDSPVSDHESHAQQIP